MAKSGKSSIGNIFVWILMGLLIAGLAGFGATSFGSGNPAIVTVGQRDVDVNRYFRAASETFRNLQAQGLEITSSSPEGQQVLEQVRGALIRDAAVENEALELGISVGDGNVAEQIRVISAFQGMDGQFDRAAYEAALRRIGMSVSDFEDDVRLETIRNLLRVAVTNGAVMPETYTNTLLDFFGERRDLSVLRFTPDALEESVAAPTAAHARAHYDANPDAFTLPERLAITYTWLTPEMLIDTVEIAREDLELLYEQRRADFVQPERRLVERLVFADTAAAQAALDRITDGSADFETLVQDRGLTLNDVDLGEVVPGDLGAASEAVFAAEDAGVVGPADSDLGPALFRINAILDPVDVTFEQALPALRTELAFDRARRVIDGQVTDLEDLLAAGATLEELSRETEMVLGSVEWWPGNAEGIAGYESFRRAASTVSPDSFPETLTLEDGGIFAIRLDEVLEPSLQPFDAVQAEAEAGWIAAREIEAMRSAADTAAAQTSVGAELAAISQDVESYTGLTRDGFIPGARPTMLETIFQMDSGDVQVIEGIGAVFVVQLDAITPPDDADPQIAMIRQALQAQVTQTLATDISTLYSRALTLSAGISLDQAAINAVHAELP